MIDAFTTDKLPFTIIDTKRKKKIGPATFQKRKATRLLGGVIRTIKHEPHGKQNLTSRTVRSIL